MPNLEQRISALEVATPHTKPLTIIRRFVSPGQPPTEIQSLRDEKGNKWQLLPGETEQALLDRASLQCARNAGGVASLNAQ